MSFRIYFDEANKLDQPGKIYSYYGAYGAGNQVLDEVTAAVQTIFEEMDSKSELHFREYNHDRYFEKYFRVLDKVLSRDMVLNILIVDNAKAHELAENMGLSILELRELFYIKIPERLFYGMTRRLNLSEHMDVQIVVDQSDEYSKLGLYAKIHEQMNAHSVYRKKGYRISSVSASDSRDSIPLQIIDTIMGIVIFLMERKYEDVSDASLIKSDLIYRLLIDRDNVEKFQSQVRLFRWEGEEELSRIQISNYLSRFMIHKTQFDVREMKKLSSFLHEYPGEYSSVYRKLMGYPNTRLRMLWGYKDELEGVGRNAHLTGK